MNARSRFSQSAIPNGHTACGPTKKTVVRGKKKKEKEAFLAHSAISVSGSPILGDSGGLLLSPLAAFTSGAYLLHNGRQWQWICKFHTAKFKGIFGGL